MERDLRKIRQRLQREGWIVLRQVGPHTVYAHPAGGRHVIVPHGRGDLPTGTALAIAMQAGWN
ncbi:type II toxin-antitoxin system HicA family toxin [uncultured Alsobacter sp.]|uniref:type II toxin-antitoxin system HicA family toxin n=1 Tax=uncultured Alsobacter sp. TaxID=1748258 RepID=UPI0025F00349|nr:type II toxin-antitoxin system HicA family toxin [uncultured Alsobacter sp.]